MKQKIRSAAALLVALVLLAGAGMPVFAADRAALDAALADTAACIRKNVQAPQVGSIGGEWAVIGLARSGAVLPEAYFRQYRADVEAYVKACGGVLHSRKYTEYSRVIVALSSIGTDARDVAGYDLTLPLGDYEKTVWQGLNGPIWALLALDSAEYPVPKNPGARVQATRQMYIDRILSCRLSDGGWNLFGSTEGAQALSGVSDPDVTGMALQALAKYQDQPLVAQATREALACMSAYQNESGGFSSFGIRNCESCAQMLVALCELGIPLNDARFVKNGNTLLDNLLSFYRKGQGFVHAADGVGANQMASEQGLYAMAAVRRALDGKNSLYRMSDALQLASDDQWGLPGRHKDVKSVPVTMPGTTFDDIAGTSCADAVRAMASRGIITGRNKNTFAPAANMNRAEFAAIVVRALGLTPKVGCAFSDVVPGAWFEAYVGTAGAYGIVNGRNASRFDPYGTITRQEAAVMVARAAKLCGMKTESDPSGVRDILAQFTDYTSAGEWAGSALAFCYREEILDRNETEIRPGSAIRRDEVAQMLFRMLKLSELLKSEN